MANELVNLVNEILENYAEAYEGWETEKGRTILFDEAAYQERVGEFQRRVKMWRTQAREMQMKLSLPAGAVAAPAGPTAGSFRDALKEGWAPAQTALPVPTEPSPPEPAPKKIFTCSECGVKIKKSRARTMKDLGVRPLCIDCNGGT